MCTKMHTYNKNTEALSAQDSISVLKVQSELSAGRLRLEAVEEFLEGIAALGGVLGGSVEEVELDADAVSDLNDGVVPTGAAGVVVEARIRR